MKTKVLVITSRSVLHIMTTALVKCGTKSQNTHLMVSNILPNIVPFLRSL